MSFFTGKFWFCTHYSMYQVTINDISESPVVMKVAIHDTLGPGGKPLVNPIGGFFGRTGFYLGISSKMVAKYRVPKEITGSVTLGSKGLILGSRTSAPMGFFLKRSGSCEDCFELLGKDQKNPMKAFPERWHLETIATFRTIGLNHPLVTFSSHGDWALPRPILDCLVQPATAA